MVRKWHLQRCIFHRYEMCIRDRLYNVGRVEPVHTGKTLRPIDSRCHLCDAHAGSVGTQDSILRNQMGNLVPEFFLHIHVLTDAFDDQVSVCKAGFVVGKCDQFDECLGFLLAYRCV